MPDIRPDLNQINYPESGLKSAPDIRIITEMDALYFAKA
jgi:hypothetical protein